MNEAALHLCATTTHRRRGAVRHGFTHSVDYVLISPEAPSGPLLFSRNRFNLSSVQDRHHGGAPGKGSGAAWAWQILERHGLTRDGQQRLRLLTQPAFLGYVFNPVSFWILEGGAIGQGDRPLLAVIAEVNNTFGDRHSYLCANPGFAPITPDQTLTARKVFHVSPFQAICGDYTFRFRITPTEVDIRIMLRNGAEGLGASLTGTLTPLRNRHILFAALARPFGSLRTIALIHWHALKLKLKGARYQRRPLPPKEEVS